MDVDYEDNTRFDVQAFLLIFGPSAQSTEAGQTSPPASVAPHHLHAFSTALLLPTKSSMSLEARMTKTFWVTFVPGIRRMEFGLTSQARLEATLHPGPVLITPLQAISI
jgi:hypothetical protein